VIGVEEDRFAVLEESSNILFELDDEVKFMVAFLYFYSSKRTFVCDTFKSVVLSNRVLTASIDKKRLLFT
jgi:hypothetical protein